jgi:hypothetical protein
MRPAVPALIVTALLVLPAFAKLPAPGPEAKTKAAAAAAKGAWADKVGAYQLCEAMNRAADQYRKAEKAAGKEPATPVATPPCVDPGPFVAQAPLGAAGAHSSSAMAVSPPSGKSTAAQLQGHPKK